MLAIKRRVKGVRAWLARGSTVVAMSFEMGKKQRRGAAFFIMWPAPQAVSGAAALPQPFALVRRHCNASVRAMNRRHAGTETQWGGMR